MPKTKGWKPTRSFDHDVMRGATFSQPGSGDPVAEGALGVSLSDPAKDPLYDPIADSGLGRIDRAKRDIGSKMKAASGKEWAGKLGLASALSDKGEELRGPAKDSVRDGLQKMTLEQILSYHRDIFREHLVSEVSVENLNFIDALESGTSDDALIAEYVENESPQMLNISGPDRNAVLDGRKTPADLEKPVKCLLADSMSRFKRSPKVAEAMADRA